MSCCNPIIIQFYNKASSTISYGPALQTQFGLAPNVTVTYWDGTQYVAAGIMTQIKMIGYPVTSIVVDHGGAPATGLIKIR
jgi:hypothetical protein